MARSRVSKALSPLFFVTLLFSLSSFVLSGYAHSHEVDTGYELEDINFDYSPLVSAVNVSAVRQHVDYFSNLGTRATGYPGNLHAAEYIFNWFVDCGLENVTYEEFPVTVCVDYGANITISDDDTTIQIRPLVPNFIVPSTTRPEGIVGKLIYAERGTFEGLDVNGSVVLLDWNSGANWLSAARLGARAVIFLPPKPREITYSLYGSTRGTTRYPTIRGEVVKCLWDAPLNFPRFYVESSAPILGKVGRVVRLVSTQRWVEKIGRNVVGFIKGKDKPEGIVEISSYYDSYSFVPAVAPGAQEALGVSALLELAKYLNQEDHKPPMTIMVVAYGGHHQALAGAVAFSTEYFFDLSGSITSAPNMTKKDTGRRVWRQYNLDLSTGSDHVYMTYEGGSYLEHNLVKSVLPGGFLGAKNSYYEWVLRDYLEELRGQTGIEYNFTVRTGYNHNEHSRLTYHPYLMPTKQFNYDHEPTLYLGPAGWTFTTAYDPRPYYWEPFDTIEKINWDNLQMQLETIYALLLRSIYNYNEIDPSTGRPRFDPTFNYIAPSGEEYPGERMEDNTWEWGGRQHWGTITGEVRTWVEEIAWYKPLEKSDLGNLSNILIFLKGVRPLDRRFVFAKGDGSFEIQGGILSEQYESALPDPTYQLSAWVIDPVNGNPVFVPDQGPNMFPTGDPRVETSPYKDIGFLTVFNASTIAILDLMYPDNLAIPQSEETGNYFSPDINMYESVTLSPPESFGIYREESLYQRIWILAFPSGESIEASLKAPWSRYPFLILANGTEDKPLGSGYASDGQAILTFPVLKYAEDFYFLNEERIEILSRYMDIAGLPSFEYHGMTEKAIQEALKAYQEGDFLKAYSLAIDAWLYGRQAYMSSRPVIEDTTSAVAFFAFLIVPFVVLMEKLLLDVRGVKKAASLLAIFTLTMLALNFSHPGFSTAGNPVSIVIGFSVLILSAPILFIILGEAKAYMRRIRIKEIGKHEIAVSRLDQTIHAFNTGIENMKKRKFRTTLTTLSIVIMISSVVGFTSLSTMTILRSTDVSHPAPPYEGVYIRKVEWGHGNFELGQPTVDYLIGKYGQQAQIVPRAWRYGILPSAVGEVSGWGETIGFTVYFNGTRAVFKAFLGLSIEEPSITNADVFLLTGGRWFIEQETKVCMIGEGQAEKLGITSKDLPVPIVVEGVLFSVIGIMARDFELITDIDNEEITPVKRDYFGGEDNPWNEHLTVDEILIMPYETVLDLGGRTSSVTLRFRDLSLTRKAAEELYTTLPGFLVCSNLDDEVTKYQTGQSTTVGGLENQIVPLFIVMLALFNMMLGSIYERRKDVGTYASLGLSPLHVATLFLAETMVYATIGGILGYLAATVQVRAYEAITQVHVANYSSSTVGMAITFAIFATILATLYPAYISSKLVTPSLARAWKIPTSPVGDMWEIPLPFTAASETEAGSILVYLHELLIQHQTPEAPTFMASNLQMRKVTIEGRGAFKISADCRLAPYQIGVTQHMEILATQAREDRWEYRVLVERTQGAVKEWTRLNRDVLNVLREQFLLWRTLSETEKGKYWETWFVEPT